MRLFLLILLNCYLNVRAQNWQQDLSFPGSPRDDGASFTIGSIHYAGTGRSIDFSCTGDFFAFDSHLNYWEPIASLPIWQERQYASAFSYDDKGYVLCGENCNGFYFNTFWKYDPSANQWTAMPELPSAGRAGCQHFMIGSDLYLIGGRNANGILNEVWCFHFATNSWEQLGNLPFEGCWRGLAFSNQTIGFLAAGRTNAANQTGWNNQTWAYEAPSDTWTPTTLFDFGTRMYVNTASADSLVFIYGGVDPTDNTLTTVEKINLNNLQSTTLTPFSALPRKGCMSFVGNGFLYLSTGIAGNDRLNETWRLPFLPNATVPVTYDFSVFQLLEGAKIMIRILPQWIGESIQVRDLQGRILEKITLEQTQQIIALDRYPTGVYLIEMRGAARPIRL